MAFWVRRNGKVYVYEFRDGRQRQAKPRKELRPLDGQPDEVIQRFVDSISDRGSKRPRLADDALEKLVDDFCEFERRRGLNPHTVYMKRLALLDVVVPFFLAQEPPLKDPTHWPFRCVRLLEGMERNGLSTAVILRTNTALSGFWSWL